LSLERITDEIIEIGLKIYGNVVLAPFIQLFHSPDPFQINLAPIIFAIFGFLVFTLLFIGSIFVILKSLRIKTYEEDSTLSIPAKDQCYRCGTYLRPTDRIWPICWPYNLDQL
jgi:hypothetical protein